MAMHWVRRSGFSILKYIMLNFCTLFNKHYLIRGITMFESLKTSQCNFHLYIFAFDTETYEILSKINDKYFTVISLAEFESDKLKKIKNSRTSQEYCWTCTPSIIYYVLSHFDLEHCIYLDADLYFFKKEPFFLCCAIFKWNVARNCIKISN